MNQEQERKVNSRKELKTLCTVIAVLVVIVSVSVFAFLRFYNAYIDNVLYQERLSQMREVTSQLFTGLEDVVQSEWKKVETLSSYVKHEKPENMQTLMDFMKEQAELNGLKADGSNLVAVDDLGRYLTEDGWQGTLEEMNLLLDEPEKLNFVSKSLTSEETSMYFLERLQEPMTVMNGDQPVNLIYYGIASDMVQLNPYFSCDAYGNSNSVYVLNDKGMRLFQSNTNHLIEGYNTYTALKNMEYLHGHSFEDARQDLDKTGRGYANAVLNGEEYYLALYKMDSAAWTLLFLVPSSYVAANVVSMVNTTVRLILIFALLVVGISTVIIFALLHFQQKKAVAVERLNSQRLSVALQKAEQAEQAAKKANRAKSDFLSNMSHDIRTPMNAIVGITKLMEHDKDDRDKMNAYIHKVQMSSQHLLSLINDVLDMSKIESSEVVLNKEFISLAEQIGQIDSIIRPQTEERGQEFVIHTRNITHEYLIGDAVRLRQIFINLLSNAVKYTPNGGKILLEVEELSSETDDQSRFRISVTDNGYGMTPEFVTHIFEPFTRAKSSTINREQGTGLGMAITKTIVDLMGGTISVKSQLDQGSCFTVEVPLLIERHTQVTIPVQSILVISDEALMIENACAALKETDITLLTAGSEAEADELLRQNEVTVVLLGSHLNGQMLKDNIHRLRKETGNARLFFCCDYNDREQLADISEKGGVDGVLVRPFFLSTLAAAMERARSYAIEEIPEKESVLKGMRFLCAEDNELNAEILKAILDMNGASCVICPNGQEIVNTFLSVKKGDFDAILMDVQMPVMNGLDATRAIRRSKNPLGRTMPIIAMTANAFSDDIQNCLNAGMDAHVSKPLDLDVLERTIKSVIIFGQGKTLK